MAAEFLIWSIEHTAWWRPHWQGYTVLLREAGRYPRAEADTILERANRVATNECLIPVSAVDASVTPDDDARTDDAILAALTAEILTLDAEGEPMVIAFRPHTVFQLAGLLQLALRHPGVQKTNRDTALKFLTAAREYFAESPAIRLVLDRGDDPTQDR